MFQLKIKARRLSTSGQHQDSVRDAQSKESAKIAVLGAGFTGLTAAYYLAKKGQQVVVFEKKDKPGGLARGYKLPNWQWSLEESYHHFFASDNEAFKLIDELGLSNKLFFKKPITSVYYKCCKRKPREHLRGDPCSGGEDSSDGGTSDIYPLDTPFNFLLFPHLSAIDKVRSAAALAYLKLTPWWQHLEKTTAKEWILKYMGRHSWTILWKPLFINKFGLEDAAKVPASWFWARIKKRSQKLGYLKGGFQVLADKLVEKIKDLGGEIHFNHKVEELNFLSQEKGRGGKEEERKAKEEEKEGKEEGKEDKEEAKADKHEEKTNKKTNLNPSLQPQNLFHDRGTNFCFDFEKVIVTLPTPAFLKITKNLFQNYSHHSEFSSESQIPKPALPARFAESRRAGKQVQNDSKHLISNYIKQLFSIKHLNALTLVLVLKKPFLDKTYWLNICDKTFPFLLLVEHTNFIDSRYYGNCHILYIGNYLEDNHPYLKKSKEELFKIFLPYLKKINPSFLFNKGVSFIKFSSSYGQPVFPLNYSSLKPNLTTPLPGLYLANQDQIYPWDRGVNYAIKLGKKVAKKIFVSSHS